jgi:HEAT repeat protein
LPEANIKARRRGRQAGEAQVDLIAVILFILCVSWVGSMIVVTLRGDDYMPLVTILAAISTGAGAAYFIGVTSSQMRGEQDGSPTEKRTRSPKSELQRDDPVSREEEPTVPSPVSQSVAQAVIAQAPVTVETVGHSDAVGAATQVEKGLSSLLEGQPKVQEDAEVREVEESPAEQAGLESQADLAISTPVREDLESLASERLEDQPGEADSTATSPAPEKETQAAQGQSEEMRGLVASQEWDRLADLGSEAIPALIEALADEDTNTRSKAAEALAKIGHPASDKLIQALADERGFVRNWAAWVLGKMEEAQAVNALISALADDYDSVRENAAWALGQIRDPRAVEALVTAMMDEYANVRQYAVSALAEMAHPETLQPLLVAIQDMDPTVRQNAASGLGQLRDAGAVEPLTVALKDPDPVVRGEVACALAQIGDQRAVDPLIEALNDEDDLVRHDVVTTLGMLKSPKAVDPLIEILKYEDITLQTSAACALADIGGSRAVDALIEAMGTAGPEVELSIKNSLAKLVKHEQA